MLNIIKFILIMLPAAAMAQVTINPNLVDFGVVERTTERVVDITLTNSGVQKTTLLRSTFNRDYSFIFSERFIAADSSITLRVKFNPMKKGTYSDRVELYFSTMNTPVILTFKADVQFIDLSDNPACPSFQDQPAGCCENNSPMVVVKNAQTGAPIPKARVRLIEQGRVQRTWTTNRSGEAGEEVPISYYYILADAPGFSPADTSSYINRRNNYFELFLQPDETLAQTPEEAESNDPPNFAVESVPIVDPEKLPLVEQGKLTTAAPPNNLVFLVDVSESMAKQGKLDILKNAMFSLSSALRENDWVSVLSYATTTEVVVEHASGTDAATIDARVAGLSAGGMTAGVKGFRGAYELALRHFEATGNNQVIVATDGAFRASDEKKLLQLVTEYRAKGLSTTIIGIRCSEQSAAVLKALAEAGGGVYLSANNYDQSQDVLLKEIIRRAFVPGGK